MRKVDCSKIDRPSCLDYDDKSSPASKELKGVLEKIDLDGAKIKYQVYKNLEIKYSLEKLFFNKCAYCETNYSIIQPVDIEHFRPKASVKVGKKVVSKGYYWLAACWENLLPSCIDCNRTRNIDFVHADSRTLSGKTGKGNQFELVDENERILKFNRRKKLSNVNISSSVDKEQALLLNPRFDEVDEYFDYSDEGVITVSDGLTCDIKRDRAQSSIETYGLNRVELVFARKQVLLLIDNYVFLLRKLLRYIDDEQSSKHRAILEEFSVYVTKFIRTLLTNEKPYCSMSRKIVRKRLKGIVDL